MQSGVLCQGKRTKKKKLVQLFGRSVEELEARRILVKKGDASPLNRYESTNPFGSEEGLLAF